MKYISLASILVIALAPHLIAAPQENGLSPFVVDEKGSLSGYMRAPGSPQDLIDHLEQYGLTKLEDNEAIRFLWLRSFHPAILFVVKCDSESTAIFTASKWTREEEKWKWVVFSESAMPKERHIGALLNVVTKYDFFKIPTTDGRQGLDGSTWIIEIKTANRHHWITRWSPTRDSPAWIIGTDLIGRSINSPAVPIY